MDTLKEFKRMFGFSKIERDGFRYTGINPSFTAEEIWNWHVKQLFELLDTAPSLLDPVSRTEILEIIEEKRELVKSLENNDQTK